MSYADGMSAINLEMPGRVPRTEYSAESHWDLVKKVTGVNIGAYSSEDIDVWMYSGEIQKKVLIPVNLIGFE